MARFTLGSLNTSKKHLVPLPWQPEYESERNRPKTACSSQDSLSNTESGESEEKGTAQKTLPSSTRQLLSYEVADDDEDVNEDEAEADDTLFVPALYKQSPTSEKDPFKRNHQHNFLNANRRKFAFRRESKIKPQSRPKEIDLRWSLVLSTRSNQDNQHCMEDDIFHRIVIDLRPEHWQKARPPLGGIFAKINRQLHEKIQRQAKLNKLAAVPKTK